MASPFARLAAEAHKLEASAVVLFHKDVVEVADSVRAALSTAENDARASIANAQPDIKAAADAAVQIVEQAILAALASHGL